jgi:hypothetical protein
MDDMICDNGNETYTRSLAHLSHTSHDYPRSEPCLFGTLHEAQMSASLTFPPPPTSLLAPDW